MCKFLCKLSRDTCPLNFVQVRSLNCCWHPETVPPISELGPDALFEPMSVDNFVDSLTKKKIGIKALLHYQVIFLAGHSRTLLRIFIDF